MSARLLVAAETAVAGTTAAALASLPVSFGPAVGAPDVLAVAGDAGWTWRAAAAIRRGARGVLVVEPVAEDPRALAAEAAAAGAAVALDQAWAGNPVLTAPPAAALDAIAGAMANAVLCDSVAYALPGTPVGTLLTRHLCAVLACGVELSGLRMVRLQPVGYLLAGRLPGGAPVALHGTTTAALPSTARVSVLTRTGRTDVTLPEASAAWPAEVRTVTADGATTLPTRFESAHRRSWLRLHAAVDSGTGLDDLERFAVVAALVRNLTG